MMLDLSPKPGSGKKHYVVLNPVSRVSSQADSPGSSCYAIIPGDSPTICERSVCTAWCHRLPSIYSIIRRRILENQKYLSGKFLQYGYSAGKIS